jgi:hypothetical protein
MTRAAWLGASDGLDAPPIAATVATPPPPPNAMLRVSSPSCPSGPVRTITAFWVMAQRGVVFEIWAA